MLASPSPSAAHAWRLIGLSIGLLLVTSAVLVVVLQRDQVPAALEAIRSPSAILVAILLSSVAVNLILSALTFSLLMSRLTWGAPERAVGLMEMQALICSTALVNFLPMRPGLFSRIAYHRAVNNIPILDSTRVLIEGALLTFGAAAVLGIVALGAHWTGWRIEALLAIGPLLILALWIAGICSRLIALAALLRYLEVLVWAVRYLVAFALIGNPIEPTVAFAIACVSILATMVPFVSNGLGLREWLVGVLAPVLAGYRLELGLTAELVHRAGEIVVVLAMGLIGMAYLARQRNRPG